MRLEIREVVDDIDEALALLRVNFEISVAGPIQLRHCQLQSRGRRIKYYGLDTQVFDALNKGGYLRRLGSNDIVAVYDLKPEHKTATD